MDRRSLLTALAATYLVSVGRGLAGCGADPGAPTRESPLDPTSTFHAIYRDAVLRDRFFPFLQNVFSLYPEEKLHALVHKASVEHGTDEAIYRAILAGLPGVTPIGSTLAYAVPALHKQKREMAEQAARLLGDGARIDGYVEMGTTGRYLNSLEKRVQVVGPVFVLNDIAPTQSPVDMVERGQFARQGAFVHLSDYAPISTEIADTSVDLVSNLIGFHHAPVAALDDFIASLRRVLRPGGKLLLREHDVTDPTMNTLVALAHDVFNAGVQYSWEDNAAQLRGFRSVADWSALLEARGFTRAAGAELQAGDPTGNTMLLFVRA
jgi:SAM-dependent methyltransferase